MIGFQSISFPIETGKKSYRSDFAIVKRKILAEFQRLTSPSSRFTEGIANLDSELSRTSSYFATVYPSAGWIL